MKQTDVLDVVKEYTRTNPGVAVKSVSPAERSVVCVNGEEKPEHGGEMLPVIERDQSAPLLDVAGYVPTTFYLGRWDVAEERFIPDGQPLSWEDFLALARQPN